MLHFKAKQSKNLTCCHTVEFMSGTLSYNSINRVFHNRWRWLTYNVNTYLIRPVALNNICYTYQILLHITLECMLILFSCLTYIHGKNIWHKKSSCGYIASSQIKRQLFTLLITYINIHYHDNQTNYFGVKFIQPADITCILEFKLHYSNLIIPAG